MYRAFIRIMFNLQISAKEIISTFIYLSLSSLGNGGEPSHILYGMIFINSWN